MRKTVFIGSVISSKYALETLIKNNVNLDLVCSLNEEAANNVSDYYPIHEIAEKHGIPFLKFNKINNDEVLQTVKEIGPEFIYVIGLSQIISEKLLNLASKYSIGFHPTPIPKHRGRAAIPWQVILGVQESKVSLFKLDKGMDSGDIIKQFPYRIEETDYAMDVYIKICEAMSEAIKESIESIYNDSVEFKKQNHENATFLLVRRPEDGKIDWKISDKEIESLIRATSKPYPGAFSFYKEEKVVFWKAHLEKNDNYIGIPGQIAWIKDNGDVGIITKHSILVLTDYEFINEKRPFIVGHKFV